MGLINITKAGHLPPKTVSEFFSDISKLSLREVTRRKLFKGGGVSYFYTPTRKVTQFLKISSRFSKKSYVSVLKDTIF